MSIKKRLLTGDRPTGKLHLGHYVGTLNNRIKLQDDYECYFIVADLHMLTTKNSPADIANTKENINGLVLDALSCGIRPDSATFYLQSAIPELSEIAVLFQSLVTVPRLERIPSLKDMARDAGKQEMSLALLSYPILQSADVLSVRAELVPVGKDNASHIEITREIARRFNHLYGSVFPEPEALIGDVPSLVGTDGQNKMSKSLGNAIYLSDTEQELKKKIKQMYTDPARVRADIPGQVIGNPVFAYHDIFNPNINEVNDLKNRYSLGKVGDVEVKDKLFVAINEFLKPIRERREQFIADQGLVEELIYTGTQKVKYETQQTVYAMRKAMGFAKVWKNIQNKANKRLKIDP